MTFFWNKTKYAAIVTNGKAQVLQIPESDVLLKIPEGSDGCYLVGTHTRHPKGAKASVVPSQDWPIAAATEVRHFTTNKTKRLTHELIIPTITSKAVQNFITVRKSECTRAVNENGRSIYQELEQREADEINLTSNIGKLQDIKKRLFLSVTFLALNFRSMNTN